MSAECKCLKSIPDGGFNVVNELNTPEGKIPIVKGDMNLMPLNVQKFLADRAMLMKPSCIYICDGSQREKFELINKLIEKGAMRKLAKYENNYIIRTDPADVARVESKTVMVTKEKFDSVCHTAEGVAPIMGTWMAPEQWMKEMDDRFPGCMAGRTLYLIPFSMGPVGGPISKIGIELTDSIYVVLCMQLMTRVSYSVFDALGENGEFVKGTHSLGCPQPWTRPLVNFWECNPEKVIISHRPKEREIWSFGSGYGGNSLLGKKCFALRIACNQARDEGWLAEHMLIMGVLPKDGKERFITGAFPSACGKTNMAMLMPGLPDYKVRTIGDDIAWMRFNDKGECRAINPENGFFGVCPGTNYKTNPMAMETFQKNSIMTNTAETVDGYFFWEGLEDEIPDKNVEIITWLNEKWKIGMPGKSAHPNSRFTTPASQCPCIHPAWEDPQGVPVEAFVFGGRRPEGVPLVFESFSWAHGIFIAACLKSEATAAAEHAGKKIMRDPFAMRPFMGYNFGKYMTHWLSINKPGRKIPRIFHVNWFRLNKAGKFLWPGFGENIRVVDWILKRLDEGPENWGKESPIGVKTPIGIVPKKGSMRLDGLKEEVDWDELMSVPKDYWQEDVKETRKFCEEQIGPDMPAEIRAEMDAQEARIMAM
jgi:phosphoenolpyruvate carboxykinase (GTP)